MKLVTSILCLCLAGCVTIPATPPLKFETHKLMHPKNPIYLFEPCSAQTSGVMVCPIGLYKSALHEVNAVHSELLQMHVYTDIMAADARVHDMADVRRTAILQEDINRLHWKVAGGVAGGILVGFLSAIIVGAL